MLMDRSLIKKMRGLTMCNDLAIGYGKRPGMLTDFPTGQRLTIKKRDPSLVRTGCRMGGIIGNGSRRQQSQKTGSAKRK